MDPVLFSLPDLLLNNREDPGLTHSGPWPFSNFSHRASQEQLHVPEPSEILHRAAGLQPGLVTDESPSPRVSTVAQMLRRRASSAQKPHALSWTQRDSNQHLIPSLTAPIEPQIHAQAGPSFLGVSPSPLQTLTPGPRCLPVLTPLVQELILTPCSPQDSCCLNTSPVASVPDSGFGFNLCTLVPISGPTEFWYSPCIPPWSLVLQPEAHPSWCLCPPMVPVHQPCSLDLISRTAAQQVSEQLGVTPESAAKPQEEQQKQKDHLQANDTEDKTSEVSPESLPPLDKETLAKLAFEEYMTIMDSLSLKIQEGVEAKENEQDEGEKKLEMENDLFLEYLEELCSNKDFVQKVESKLNTDFLNSLVSPDPDPIDLLPLRELQQEQPLEVILQQHLHPPPADSNSETPATEETSPATSHVGAEAQSLILDPPGSLSDSNPNHDAPPSARDIGSKEGWTTFSPLLPEEPLPTSGTQKYYNSVDAISPLYYDGSLFVDYNVSSSLQPLANILPDISLTSNLEAEDDDALVEELAALFPSESPSNLEDSQSTQTSQKPQEGPPPGDPPASESPSTSSISGSSEDSQTNAVKDPAPSFSSVSPPQSAGPRKTLPPPPAQIREPEEPCNPKNINLEAFCLEDWSVTVPVNSSSDADSHAESCDCNLSDSVPEEQKVAPPKRLQVSQEFASSVVSSELRPGEWGETERKCEEGIGKQTAIKAREEGMTKMTFERKEENKENETKVKGATDKIHSRRPSGQIEKEIAREKSEKSMKKTAKLTPEGDGVISENQKRCSLGGKQLSKREESRATKTANVAEQFSEAGEKERQKPTGEMQELKVEGGEQCEAKTPKVCTEIGPENALLAKTAQEEKDLGEGRVERKEEGVQMSSFFRRTRSTSIEEKVQQTPLSAARTRGKIKPSEMEGKEMKSSPKREMQEEVATEPVSSPMKRRSPRAQTETRSTNGSIKESPGEGPPDEINKRPSVESCEENPNATPALCPETRQQSKTVDRQAERETGQHDEVTGTETRNFYSLRSLNVSKRTAHRREATLCPSNPKPSPDQTEGINGEEAERPGLIILSPTKRSRHGGASEERETMANETDVIGSSPTKRGRHKRRVEVNSERDEEEQPNEKGEDEAETSGCKPSPPSTGRKIKAKDKKILNVAGRETSKGGKSCVKETRSSRKEARIAGTRQTRPSKKLPTKYKDFILCKTNGRKRQLGKEKGKAGKGKTSRGGRK